MEGNIGRATKTTVFVAVFLAFLMLGVPALSTSGTFGVTDNAAAAPGDRALRIGWVGMTGSISTLNPLLYTMADEMMTIWPCYSTLFTYDVNTKEIGDLVKSYTASPDGLTWDFKLVDSAVFYDKNRAALSQPMIPVTARDVIFTFSMIANETTNNLASYFPKIGGVSILQSMTQGATPFDLRIVLSDQYAPFVSGALHSIPILPRYIWINYYDPPNHKSAWNWDNFAAGVAPIIGSGFFYYNLNDLPSTGVVELYKSPTWFQTQERGWDLRPDKLLLKSELSADSNYQDLVNGNIDIMEYVSPDQYVGALSTLSRTTRFASSTGFVYEYNLNQMTDAYRASLGGKFGTGSNNQLLLDPIVKQAIAMSVDRQQFIDVVYNGLGQPGDSLVPYAHPYHYAYGVQAPAGRAPPGETAIPYDPDAARAMLMNAGWRYRLDGTEILVGNSDFFTYAPLCKQGATSPLQFHFWTLSDSPEWNLGGQLLVEYAAAVGVDLGFDYQLKTVNDMNGIWASADYDMWLWDWVFTPVSEISVDVLQVMTTEAIGSWSDIFWSDPAYDALYYQSLTEMDPAARMAITDEMQRIAYENMGCQLLAYRADLFAARTNGPDNWQNWGDWSVDWLLEPGQLAPWLYLQIEPQDNNAPDISTQATYPDAIVGTPKLMTASATDNNVLEYRWFYGDGTKSAWQSSPATSHTYSRDGYYTAYVAAREVDGSDQFVTVTQTTVTVSDLSNTPPTGVDFTFSPSNPDSGKIVYLNGTATDQPGDTLYYSWNFGDGGVATGQNVTHQFTLGVTSSVTLSVDDHHLGTGTRPVNVTKLVPVTANSPPTISVPSNPAVIVRKATDFTVSWGDADTGDSHRFTWSWGDGSTTVTTTNMASHSYAAKGVKTMTVWIDDLTNLPGHNVSGFGLNTVIGQNNKAPAISSPLAANTTATVTGWLVNFTVSATDADGDILGFTFEFGDGEYAFDNVTAPATVSALHSYATPGFYDAYVYVTDYQATPLTSGPWTVDVAQGNSPPVVDRPSPGSFHGTVGSPISFHAWANDSNGNPLTYYWDYGDGEYGTGLTTTHSYLQASGSAGFAYRVWVNDNNGSNVSSLPSVAVLNAVPNVVNLTTVLLNLTQAVAGHTFTASATDEDLSDTLTYTWYFGDGTGEFVGNGIVHSFLATAADYTYMVNVSDGFVDDFGVSHTVTKTGTVRVYQVSLSLVAGWNFLSVPTTGYVHKASNLGLVKNDVVSGWNPATKTYDKNYIVGVSPLPLDFTIAASTGYWVYAGSNETLYLHGMVPTTSQTRTITLPAGGGWFILGLNTLNTTWKASKIPTMYTGGTITTVASYNPVTKTYKSYIAGVPPTDFTLVPGQAYWCFANAGGTLSYSP